MAEDQKKKAIVAAYCAMQKIVRAAGLDPNALPCMGEKLAEMRASGGASAAQQLQQANGAALAAAQANGGPSYSLNESAAEVNAYVPKVGTPEYNALVRTLTPAERETFDKLGEQNKKFALFARMHKGQGKGVPDIAAGGAANQRTNVLNSANSYPKEWNIPGFKIEDQEQALKTLEPISKEGAATLQQRIAAWKAAHPSNSVPQASGGGTQGTAVPPNQGGGTRRVRRRRARKTRRG